ncbi:MAG: hypothetical protein ACK4OG_06755 [Parvibaculum sp.]
MKLPASATVTVVELTDGGISLMLMWRGTVIFAETVDSWPHTIEAISTFLAYAAQKDGTQ